MLESHYNKLDPTEKLMYQQVAANPAYNKLLYAEKEALEQQILNFYRLEKESDQEYCRRLEKIKEAYSLVKALININSIALK